MKESNLTMEQENKINNLLGVVIEQAGIFPNSDPLLVKIPFLKLQNLDISFSEAKDLVRYINRKIGTGGSHVDILNGTIFRHENVIGTMVTEIFEELNGVDSGDEKDSLILWIRNLDVIKDDAEKFLDIDISRSGLKSHYENNKITVGNKWVGVTPNSNYSEFCEMMFDKDPKTPISYADIWKKITGDEFLKMSGKEMKSISNLGANLNKKLRNGGIKKSLFSQKNPVMFRNY